SGSHAWQNANVMLRLEPVLSDFRPDRVIVYGDTNSTLAAALVSANVGIPVAHVEAGLRSFDRTMPEELNRVVTDRLSDVLFTPSRDADANLAAEGIDASSIYFVGNVMIDTLLRALPRTAHRQVLDELGLGGLARKPGEADAAGLAASLELPYATELLLREAAHHIVSGDGAAARVTLERTLFDAPDTPAYLGRAFVSLAFAAGDEGLVTTAATRAVRHALGFPEPMERAKQLIRIAALLRRP
ncbi:MAG: UDP-N-acetylglucosamine 2-epimerase, partial [Proteobacteria bacterium]|nr:UDP-N-acetylglucosamine 2-epimerase [Pseudomonadota bacterium]